MNPFLRALCVSIGPMLIILGMGAAIIFMLVQNIGFLEKVGIIAVCLAVVVFGWWMLRCASVSLRDVLRSIIDAF